MKVNQKLSVITVHRNDINALALTLSSVKSQFRRAEVEYIVVDGASNDGSLILLENQQSEVDVLHSSSDRGVYDAMNKGVQLASGSWIYFLNAGDVFVDQSSIGLILDGIDTSDVLFSDVLVNDGSKTFTFNTSFDKRTLNHQGFVYRRELHEKFGPYSVINGFTAADYFFFLQLHGLKVKKLFTPIAIFKTGGLSSTVTAVRQKYCLDFLSGKIGALNLASRLVIYPIYRFLSKGFR